MLSFDSGNFYNSKIVSNHDTIFDMCSVWMDHYNFLLGLSWNTEEENALLQNELDEYIVFDV